MLRYGGPFSWTYFVKVLVSSNFFNRLRKMVVSYNANGRL
jgi:hypothetical protein